MTARHRGWWVGVFASVVLLAACDGGTRPISPPASSDAAPPPAEVAPASPPAEVIATPTGPTPAAPSLPVAVAPPADPAALIGWWRSGDVCLELFANGDFELSDIGDLPKVMVMGTASVTAGDAGSFTLQLTTARIWKGRYVSACRKHHETGDFIESRDMLGVVFAPGRSSTLRLRRVSDTQVELCGERCATLTRDTPTLVARWRRAQLVYPDQPERKWQAGDLLELDLDRNLGHVWAGAADGKFATVYARVTIEHTGPDRFTVTLQPQAPGPGDVVDPPPSALGLPLAAGVKQALQVRRLAGERIEVCAAADRCATLERQFDAYHYELD